MKQLSTFLKRTPYPLSVIATGLFGDLLFWYVASTKFASLDKPVQSLIYFLLMFGGLMVIVGVLWLFKMAKASFGKDATEYSDSEEIQ